MLSTAHGKPLKDRSAIAAQEGGTFLDIQTRADRILNRTNPALEDMMEFNDLLDRLRDRSPNEENLVALCERFNLALIKYRNLYLHDHLSRCLLALEACQQGNDLDGFQQERIFKVLVEKYHQSYALSALDKSDPLFVGNLSYKERQGAMLSTLPAAELRKNIRNILDRISESLPEMSYGIACKLQVVQEKLMGMALRDGEREYFQRQKNETDPLIREMVLARKRKADISFQSEWETEERELANSALRHYIHAQTALVQRWASLLDNEQKKIPLYDYDLTGMDLSNLDLRYLDLRGCQLQNSRLDGAQFNADQFLFTRGVMLAESISPDARESIRKLQHYNATEALGELERNLEQYKRSIEDIELLGRLVLRTAALNVSELTDVQVARLIVMALENKNINLLPSTSEISHQNLVSYKLENNRSKLEGLPRERLIEHLDTVINGRNHRIPAEIIAHAQYEQVNLLFNELAPIKERLDFVREVNDAWQFSGAHSLSARLGESTTRYGYLKGAEKEFITRYRQNLITTFTQSLFDEPDDALGFGPGERFENILGVARGFIDIFVDLTEPEVDLSMVIPSNPKVDFTDVCVKLTPTQEKYLYGLDGKYAYQRYASFYQAIDHHDFERINSCLAQGLSPNYQDSAGRTPFMRACIGGNADVVAHLLLKGAQVDLATEKGWRIIETVARMRFYAIGELLIGHGAELDLISACCLRGASVLETAEVSDINTLHHSGEGLLHTVVLEKMHELIAPVIQAGGFVDIENKQEETPLYLAVSRKDSVAANILLENGAKVTNKIVYLACELQQKELAQLLFERLNEEPDDYVVIYFELLSLLAHIQEKVNEVRWNKMSLLALACRIGRDNIVQWLIERKADLYALQGGKMPICYAIDADHDDIVRRLLIHGFSATAVIRGQSPAIHYAVDLSKEKSVAAILAYYKSTGQLDAIVNCIYDGRTPLMKAAVRGNLVIAESLCRAGADVYARDRGGNLPLHLAADGGHEELVKLFAHRMLQTINKAGQTAADMAKESGHEAIHNLLPTLWRSGPQRRVRASSEFWQSSPPTSTSTASMVPVAKEREDDKKTTTTSCSS